MRRMRSPCCARTASGHPAAVPPRSVMNSRRRIASPKAPDKASYRLKLAHFKRPLPMSALPPKADMCGARSDVCFGPKADIGILFDHVAGLRKQRWWDRYAERLSRFEIDHQFVLGWRLHGKIGGLLAL